jgi:hypothetical protein
MAKERKKAAEEAAKKDRPKKLLAEQSQEKFVPVS